MSAFTPGPWRVGVGGSRVVAGPHSAPVELAYCNEDHAVSTTEGRANARLIAAAPELVKALEGLQAYCSELHDALCDLDTSPTHDDLIDRYDAPSAAADAALAKAKGEA